MAEIYGTDFADFISDTSESDTIYALGGNDRIRVTAGTDMVYGNTGIDTLIADYGYTDRTLYMNVTPSALGGFSGQLYDVVFDGTGPYVSFDSIENFDITTGSGNDRLNLLSVGSDLRIRTGAGDDFVASGGGVNTIDLGSGINGWSADYSTAMSNISVNFVTGTFSGPGTVTGFSYTETFFTGWGNDTIVTSAGNYGELINTGGGNDTITVSRGFDQVYGSTGNDTLIVDYRAADGNVTGTLAYGSVLGGFSGTIGDGLTSSVSYDSIENFDVTTGEGNDRLDFGLVNTNLKISTGAGDDFVSSGQGVNAISLGSGVNGWSGDFSNLTAATPISVNFLTGSFSGPGSATGFSYTRTFSTGAGNDTIVSSSGSYIETFNTGGGNDSITVYRGYDTVNASTGIDTLIVDYSLAIRNLSLSGASASVVGGFDGIIADGTYSSDGWSVFFTSIEKFDITTGEGNDTLYLGNVDTDLRIRTGTGDDFVATGRGANTIDLGAGVNGWSANFSNATTGISVNFATGTFSGPGSATGFSYTTVFTTGSGNDSITTSTGSYNEQIYAGGGNDTITVYRGFDDIAGEGGNDTLVVDYSAAIRNIQLSYIVGDATTGYSGVLGDTFSFWQTRFSGIENFDITTGEGIDTLDFSSVTTDLRINTGAGDDTVTGGSGNDLIIGGIGTNILDGGPGNDTISYRTASSSVTVRLTSQGGVQNTGVSLDTLNGFENVTGSAFDDTLTGDGNDNILAGLAGNDTLNGGAGNDTASYADAAAAVRVNLGLTTAQNTLGAGTDTLISIENLIGSAFADTLTGNGGSNRLYGGDGADKLDGGAGADYLEGGAGNDIYYVDNAGDVVVEAAAEGNDTVYSTISYTLGSNVEILRLQGTAALNGTGNELANTIVGNSAGNLLSGLGGRDTLTGGTGNDTLVGGAGADVLTGGGGSDIFVFDSLTTSADKDTVRDFAVGEDQIAIVRAAFAAFAGDPLGALSANAFAVGTAATTADQHLIYNSLNGALYYDVDGVGGAAQIQIAVFTGAPALSASDFVLI